MASYGGSLSGEHGDGRARSELLPIMYPARVIDLFRDVKTLFDPDGLLNPGVLVTPRQVDDDLRLTARSRAASGLAIRLTHDGGDLSAAVHRCTGVGKCLADNAADGGVMCPSYQATHNEKDSTRGRARVLQDMVSGAFDAGEGPSWRAGRGGRCARAVPCLQGVCLGLPHRGGHGLLQGRGAASALPPADPTTQPLHLGLAAALDRSGAERAGAGEPDLRQPRYPHVLRWGAGIDQRRPLPHIAQQSFRSWATRRRQLGGDGPRVVLWADTFTDHFTPAVGRAAVDVLERAGYRVEVPTEALCCGLTWISTGQLGRAKKMLARTLVVLSRYTEGGVPLVGLEPSCTAVLRADAPELVADPRARTLSANVHTVAELLQRTPGWEPPDLEGISVVAQPHCHHASVLGWDADAALLGRAGAQVHRVAGCCGLAGNFGMEKGNYEVSVAVAEHDLLPAVRAATPDSVVVADGFSCRTQLDHLGGVDAIHLAELLAREYSF